MLVRVVNKNVHPYKEKFRGKDIVIEAGGSIEMDVNEAHMFLGTMNAIEVDGNGIPKATSYKMLSISTEPQPSVVNKFKCMADGKEFHSQAELDKYILANHADALADEDTVEVLTKKRGRPAKT